MQAFKKKDPYIKSTRYEVIKPTFNGKNRNPIYIFTWILDASQVFSN